MDADHKLLDCPKHLRTFLRIIPLHIQIQNAQYVVASLYKHLRSGSNVFKDIVSQVDFENDKLRYDNKVLQGKLKAVEAKLAKSLDDNKKLQMQLKAAQDA